MKHNTKMIHAKHTYNQQQHQYRQNKRVVINNNGNDNNGQLGVGNNGNRKLQQQGGDSSNNNNNNNKRTQNQQHSNDNEQKKFSFPMVNKDIQKLMNQVIDSILKQRNTIILAKLAKDNLLPRHYFSTTINKSRSSSLFALQSSSSPLMNKSLDEINHYYCTEISTKVVKKVVQYLKMSQLCAKVVSTGYIIDNLGSGFNFGGLTYWDYGSDGQKTVTRKLPQIGLLAQMRKSQSQQQQRQSSSSNMMVSEQAQQHLQQQQQQFSQTLQQQYKQLQRDSLLIVTVYLLKYEQSFRASNN